MVSLPVIFFNLKLLVPIGRMISTGYYVIWFKKDNGQQKGKIQQGSETCRGNNVGERGGGFIEERGVGDF